MKSRWIVNLLLLAAIAILGLIAHFEPGIETPAQPQGITGLDLEAVHRIHLNRPVRGDLVLLREAPGRWIVDGEPVLPADTFKVRALARLAEARPVRSYTATNLDLPTLQLAPPYASAVLNDIAVEFGGLEPLDDLRYVRVGEHVYLIADTFIQLIEADASQFVRRRLFAEGSRIAAIELPGFSVNNSAAGWQTDLPDAPGADALQGFVTEWERATSLYTQRSATQNEGDAITVRLEGHEQPVRLLIVAREPELVLERPAFGIQYRMGDAGDTLIAPPQAANAAAQD